MIPLRRGRTIVVVCLFLFRWSGFGCEARAFDLGEYSRCMWVLMCGARSHLGSRKPKVRPGEVDRVGCEIDSSTLHTTGAVPPRSIQPPQSSSLDFLLISKLRSWCPPNFTSFTYHVLLTPHPISNATSDPPWTQSSFLPFLTQV